MVLDRAYFAEATRLYCQAGFPRQAEIQLRDRQRSEDAVVISLKHRFIGALLLFIVSVMLNVVAYLPY